MSHAIHPQGKDISLFSQLPHCSSSSEPSLNKKTESVSTAVFSGDSSLSADLSFVHSIMDGASSQSLTRTFDATGLSLSNKNISTLFELEYPLYCQSLQQPTEEGQVPSVKKQKTDKSFPTLSGCLLAVSKAEIPKYIEAITEKYEDFNKSTVLNWCVAIVKETNPVTYETREVLPPALEEPSENGGIVPCKKIVENGRDYRKGVFIDCKNKKGVFIRFRDIFTSLKNAEAAILIHKKSLSSLHPHHQHINKIDLAFKVASSTHPFYYWPMDAETPITVYCQKGRKPDSGNFYRQRKLDTGNKNCNFSIGVDGPVRELPLTQISLTENNPPPDSVVLKTLLLLIGEAQ